MTSDDFVPPGQHPRDQAYGTKPPVDFQLERLHTYLVWNCEHIATFLKCRQSDPKRADQELGHLQESTDKAYEHYKRLIELLEAGYRPSFQEE